MKLKYFNPFYWVTFVFVCMLEIATLLCDGATKDAIKLFERHK